MTLPSDAMVLPTIPYYNRAGPIVRMALTYSQRQNRLTTDNDRDRDEDQGTDDESGDEMDYSSDMDVAEIGTIYSQEDDSDDNSDVMPESETVRSADSVEAVVYHLEELEEFAAYFKQKRIHLGFTQGDVGLAMGRLYGNDFSQTTVSRFEALNLSFKNMCKLKPLLEKWLNDAEKAIQEGVFTRDLLRAQQSLASTDGTQSQASGLGKRRKKRTRFEGNLRQVLEEVFNTNPRPSPETMNELAAALNMHREVVRVWFCNRRQKERRQNPGIVFPSEKPGTTERFVTAARKSGLHETSSASVPPVPKPTPKRPASGKNIGPRIPKPRPQPAAPPASKRSRPMEFPFTLPQSSSSSPTGAIDRIINDVILSTMSASSKAAVDANAAILPRLQFARVTGFSKNKITLVVPTLTPRPPTNHQNKNVIVERIDDDDVMGDKDGIMIDMPPESTVFGELSIDKVDVDLVETDRALDLTEATS